MSSNGYYACKGNISGFTSCDFVSTESTRAAAKIPRDLAENSSFLAKYKFIEKNIRIFPAQKFIPPLTEMRVHLFGKIMKKAKFEEDILKLGGKPAAAIDQTLHFCVTTREIFDKFNSKEQKSERLLKEGSVCFYLILLDFDPLIILQIFSQG